MNLTLKRTPGVYLVGFMGSGKSTVGKVLAARLGWRFIDLDEQIEQREAATISAIFAARGEEAFRLAETDALAACVRLVECGQPAVVALGGGAYTLERNRELLRDRGVTVWLDCPFATVQRRVGGDPARPLAQDAEHFAALYDSRRTAYVLADIRVEAGGDDADVTAAAILGHPALR